MADLTEIRTRIDAIDTQICDLFAQRMQCTHEVAEYKRESGKPILKRGKKQPVKGASDSEIIPLNENIDDYMAKNVLPYNPLAYIDPAKDKIGYEIPFTRLFYKFEAPESSASIFEDIKALEAKETILMKELFGNA